jgi:hypothetical protein
MGLYGAAMPAALRPGSVDAWGTERRSRIFPGPFLVHADLHNHTTLSDGAGDPAAVFPSLRANGLDVAAITDHSRCASAFLDLVSAPRWAGIDSRDWRLTAGLADTANVDGQFVALRGFEWSDLLQGHLSVWGSEQFTDPLRTFPSMGRMWRWLERHTGRPEPSFGAVVAGFNHPGTGPRRFGGFALRPALVDHVVTQEIFNKSDEYLFSPAGRVSPLCESLDAGWRTGLIGVTDEHGADWGRPDGKGRAGLYVHQFSRRGVAEALRARRVFASRIKGLRVDAALTSRTRAGQRARMGTDLAHTRGAVLVEVDLDRGSAWRGRRLGVQVLRPGRPAPTLAIAVEVSLPTPDEPVVSFEVDLDRADGAWVVLRVTDPSQPADPRSPREYATLGRGIAYASPWWLTE